MGILKKGPGKGKGSIYVWKDDELELLKKYYSKYGSTGRLGCIERLANLGGIRRTRQSVTAKSRKLGLFFLGEKKTTFKKGFSPANKGKKMPAETRAKIEHTMFKKGHKIYNEKEIGTLRWQKHKKGTGNYWMIKIANHDWRLLHRELYQKAYDISLGKDDIIRFKDGNSKNLEINNLELVTRKEVLMKNNPKLHYPPEIVKLIELVNKLNRKIKNGKSKSKSKSK